MTDPGAVEAAANAATLALVGAVSGVAATVIAGGALVLSIVNYVQARETDVMWRLDHVMADPVDGRARLVNTSTRLSGAIIAIEDPDDSEGKNRIDTEGLTFPAEVLPGNSVRLFVWQYLDGVATRVRITWTQPRRLMRWRKARQLSVILFR